MEGRQPKLMVDVAGYLNSKDLHLKRADARNVHTACIFCNEDSGRRGRLYINIDPDAEPAGLYFCHLCEAKGSLASLKRHFGDQVDDTDLDHQTHIEILSFAATYYSRALRTQPAVQAYLQGPRRGLRPETIHAHQLGYAAMNTTRDVATKTTAVAKARHLYTALRDEGYTTSEILATGLCADRDGTIIDALSGMITIPYIVARNVVTIRGRTWPATPQDFDEWDGPTYTPTPAKYKTLAGTGTRLFNSDTTWNATELVLAEGECDAMILEQEGFAAVGVPGATAWQDSWDDYLTNTQRVFVAYDGDPAGEKAARKLLDRIGSKGRRITLGEPGVKCDPTQWFATDGHTRDEFEALLSEARRGSLIVTVHDARDEFERVQNTPGLNFKWESFDDTIQPGLQPAQILIILARTGVGKSVALMNLMHRARMNTEQRDLKILFVSLEQTRGEWWDRARRIHRFFHLESNEEEAARFWQNNLLMVDRNRLTETELRQAIEDASYQFGRTPDLLCLDYLGYFARGYRGDPYERTSNAVMAIKAIGKDYQLPIVMPHQVSRSGQSGQEFGGDGGRDSVTGDALITLANGDRQPIAQLVGQHPEVIVADEHGQLTTRRADRVWRKGKRPVLEITTKFGRRLTCTASHPLLTIDGWRPVKELNVGDAIAVPEMTSADDPVKGVLRYEQITRITPAGSADVYDMSVAGIHNFIANEILVKNSGVVEETADFLLTMWSPDHQLGREEEERNGQIHVRLAKSRHGGRGSLFCLQFAPISLVMLPEFDELCARARQEIVWRRKYGGDWAQACYRHLTGFDGHLESGPAGHVREINR
jgi:replicative DNA helicase